MPGMIDPARYPRLSRIDSPADLRTFDESELPAIAEELRAYLIESVGRSGGHFGAGLGVVELTVALHWLYETPSDQLVWDVGHQGYPHKILTGRRDRIHTVKQKDGVAPFPKREESEYDTFGVGHSSTSISAALGMAIALQQAGDPRHVVAVIGDGAMTAGMAYEALNHAGGMDEEPNLLVILNDNRMSISEAVGGVTKMLGRMTASSGTSATRATRTRSSPAAATASTRSSSRTAWHPSPSARNPSTTPSASAIPPPRSRPRWAWPSPTPASATTARWWR